MWLLSKGQHRRARMGSELSKKGGAGWYYVPSSWALFRGLMEFLWLRE